MLMAVVFWLTIMVIPDGDCDDRDPPDITSSRLSGLARGVKVRCTLALRPDGGEPMGSKGKPKGRGRTLPLLAQQAESDGAGSGFGPKPDLALWKAPQGQVRHSATTFLWFMKFL
jgi:hypothetical protein